MSKTPVVLTLFGELSGDALHKSRPRVSLPRSSVQARVRFCHSTQVNLKRLSLEPESIDCCCCVSYGIEKYLTGNRLYPVGQRNISLILFDEHRAKEIQFTSDRLHDSRFNPFNKSLPARVSRKNHSE